jgi:hypothetical protein
MHSQREGIIPVHSFATAKGSKADLQTRNIGTRPARKRKEGRKKGRKIEERTWFIHE